MRRLLSIITLCLLSLTLHAANKASHDLRNLLVAMAHEQNIHPDSLFPNIKKFEARKNAITDPTEKAITQAVLGYLYHQCRRRASAREYLSEMDSTDMKTWSYDEWDRMAVLRYSEALSDLDLLHRAKLSDWAPLVKKGKHDNFFDKDMLMVVIRAAEDVGFGVGENLIKYYESQGNRQGVLYLKLRELLPIESNRAELLHLLDEYKDLDLCGEIYGKLADIETKDSLRVAWLREGIKRYPGYVGVGLLRERLQYIQQPTCQWSMPTNRPYPGETYDWELRLQNVTKVRLSLYRLSDSFRSEDYNDAKNPVKYLSKHATLLSQQEHVASPHQPWETFCDTLQWKAPDLGRYMLVMHPTTNMKLRKKVKPNSYQFCVTRLFVNTISLPGDKLRVFVADALSGQPLNGVSVDFFQRPVVSRYTKLPVDTTYFAHSKTNSDGIVDLSWPLEANGRRKQNMAMNVGVADDVYHPEQNLTYSSLYYNAKDDHDETVNIYTDRSIYRPGQTVHVGGVITKRVRWDEGIITERDLTLTLYNPNYKEVGKVDLVTDSLGVFSADFQLPESGLPGVYYLETYGRRVIIRVEEYKRPTFEVKTEDAPALQMPADSITLTGLAVNYNGAPVRSARVVGRYSFSEGRYYWWGGAPSRYDAKTDTVLTDDQGRFRVTLPIKGSKSELRYGRLLKVSYDVTSPTGETHSAEQSVFLCSSPLRLFTNIPRKQDKDQLSNWSILVATSTGKEVDGDVQLRFEQNKKLVYSTSVKSGSAIRPDFLKYVDSGIYTLKMETVLNGDTAKSETQLVVFSQHDTRPVETEKLWFYAPKTTFAPGQPARVLVGSSEHAYIYYVLTSNDELVDSRLVEVNDSIFTLDIPYETRFGQGLQLNVLTVLENKFYSETTNIRLVQPDKQLKHKWITFRDKLQPGQHETWQLQLLRPDGTPANANLMASLYDASLDALRGHDWYIYHNLQYHIYSPCFGGSFRGGSPYLSNDFSMKEYKEKEYSFAHFDHELFRQARYGYVKNLKVRGNAKSGMVMGGPMVESVGMVGTGAPVRSESAPRAMQEVMVFSKSANEPEFDAVDEDSQERVAGLDVVPVGEQDVDPVVTLRENFNETAFFYPTLRTNERGELSLEFTLPESLTTWRLLGLAHTQDVLTTLLDEKVVAQKDLMAQLSLPRFLRQGDKATLSATLFNISNTAQKGRAVFTVLDAATEKVLLKQRFDFNLGAKSDSVVMVPFNVPEDATMLICRWAAEGSTCSDGEQRYLPVLSNKEWITETRALTYTRPGVYTEDVEKMFAVKNATNKQLTIEYVSQPVWYAIQALPSLAWPQNNDVLSLTTAYYAGAISRNIAQQNPTIETAINKWKQEGKMQKSKLLENEDLKNIIIENSPWISLAEQETERIQRLSTLFDEATGNSLQKEYLDKIRSLQNSDGSFSWYPGMKGSYYMTREVAYLLTRLKVLTGQAPQGILNKAVQYIREDRPTYLGTSALRYLYVLYQSDTQMDRKDKHNADSLMKAMMKHPENLDLEQRALASIVLHKAGKTKNAQRYLESVKQFLVTNDEGLTYFEFPEGSFTSVNRKLHIHVQALEAIQMLSPQDSVLIDGMQRYLLRHKRTSEWDTPVNSANAIYALLLDNAGVLEQGSDARLTLQQKSNRFVLPEEESSFGFIRQRINLDDPAYAKVSNPQTLKVEKRGKQESWGGIYAQYLAPLADVEASSSGLNVRRQLYTEKAAVGDRIHTRYVIQADRDYEYVALNIPRAATMEPADQISGYRWQHGLACYRAVKDASTQYFIDYLPRGTYVIEEDLLVERPGEYSSGVATIQCLYAPEFSAHSKDARVVIK